MGLWRDQILPRCVARVLAGEDIAKERPRCVGRAAGRVLEIGFGAGLNLPHYGPDVTEVLALDPAAANRKLAQERIAAARFPVSWVGLESESIPLPDAAVDCVVTTFTLCTIADLARAFGEMRRVLRPDGRLLFLEHGLSPDAKVARWQHRLNPIHHWWAGGCHLDRAIDVLVRDAGFAIAELESGYMKGPKLMSYLYCGVGRPGRSLHANRVPGAP